MNDIDIEEAWDTLRVLGVSPQTLDIVTAINGYSIETMESILYAHVGYKSFDQLDES